MWPLITLRESNLLVSCCRMRHMRNVDEILNLLAKLVATASSIYNCMWIIGLRVHALLQRVCKFNFKRGAHCICSNCSLILSSLTLYYEEKREEKSSQYIGRPRNSLVFHMTFMMMKSIFLSASLSSRRRFLSSHWALLAFAWPVYFVSFFPPASHSSLISTASRIARMIRLLICRFFSCSSTRTISWVTSE